MNNNYHNLDGNNNNKFILKVAETFSKFVGRGIALIDPKTIEEYGLRTGDVLELTHGYSLKKVMFYFGPVTQMITVRD